MTLPLLRAIFFDIDDTLYSSTEFAGRAREASVDAMLARGLAADRARVLTELARVVEEFGSNDSHHFQRLLDRLPSTATARVNPSLLVSAGMMAYHETKWRELRLRPEACDVLQTLAATQVALGVVTAGITGKQMEKVLRLGIDRWVDPGLIFITDQVGIAKTNPRLYKLAARKARVAAGEAMHVGDHPTRDVESAARAGLVTVWHRGSGKYAALRPSKGPNHVIGGLEDLPEVLTSHYRLAP